MKSIRSKIIFIALLGIFSSAAIIGGYGVFFSDRIIKKSSSRILDLLAESQTVGLNGIFENVEQSVNLLSFYAEESLPSIKNLEKEEDCLDYLERLDALAFFIANCTKNCMAIYVRYDEEVTKRPKALLWRTINGKFIHDNPAPDDGYTENERREAEWFYQPKNKERPLWLGPYYNEDFKKYVISYLVPVYKNGSFFAVVGIDIDFNDIALVVNSLSVYQSGYAFLTDTNFMTVYHKSLPSGINIRNESHNFREIPHKNGSSAHFEYTFKNKKMRMAYKDLKNGMRLLVTAPVEEIDRDRTNFFISIVIYSSIMSLIIALICISMASKITRPIHALTQVAKNVAGGDYNVKIQRTSNDEIGELTDSFISAAASLKKHISYMNNLAYMDAMTGVKNKRAFIDERNDLDALIKESQETKKDLSFAVVVFDVNNLKNVNDNHGHKVGDALIKNASWLISHVFKNSDIFRIGGDEFVAVLNGSDYDERLSLLEVLAEQMATARLIEVEPAEMISIASGLAVFDSLIDKDFQSVFERADDAMYHTKVAMKDGKDVR